MLIALLFTLIDPDPLPYAVPLVEKTINGSFLRASFTSVQAENQYPPAVRIHLYRRNGKKWKEMAAVDLPDYSFNPYLFRLYQEKKGAPPLIVFVGGYGDADRIFVYRYSTKRNHLELAVDESDRGRARLVTEGTETRLVSCWDWQGFCLVQPRS